MVVHRRTDPGELAGDPGQGRGLHVVPRPASREAAADTLCGSDHGPVLVGGGPRDHGEHTERARDADIRRQDARDPVDNDGTPRGQATMRAILRILLRLLRISAGVRAHTRRQGAVAVNAYKRRRA